MKITTGYEYWKEEYPITLDAAKISFTCDEGLELITLISKLLVESKGKPIDIRLGDYFKEN